MSDILSAVRRIGRQVVLAIGRGRIQTTDDSGSVQLLQVRLNQAETIDKLPRLAEFGFTSFPPASSDAIVVFVAGDRSNGVVVGTNDQRTRLRGLKEGDSAIFDARGRFIWLGKDGGISVDAAGGPVEVSNVTILTVNATEKIRAVTPILECTGQIKDLCDSEAGTTMSEIREKYDVHDHDIQNVQGGGSTITSKKPNQQL